MNAPTFPEYPFTSHEWIRDGLRMHFIDEGAGEPLVMVHGNPTWSYYYRHIISNFRDSYRCIAPDHIGCGLSDKPDPSRYDYSLQRRIDDFTAFMSQIPGKVTLIVHDWGGMIGTAWAVRHTDRVARMVILNTGAFHLPKSKPFPWALWLGRNTRIGAAMILRANAFSWAASRIGSMKGLPAEVRKAYVAPYDSPAHRIATLRFVQTIPLRPTDPGYDIVSEVEAGLPRLQAVPKLLCWGMRDFVFDRHFLAEWERHFPDAEVHRFPRAGHYVLEDAREAIIGHIRDFLQRTR